MIVKCPQCNREYNVDERLLSPKGAMGKCKPCGIRFKIEPPGGVAEEITCPKCGFKQTGGTECRTCGIVFDKLGMEAGSGAPADSPPFAASTQRPAEGFSPPPPPPPPPLHPPQMRSAAGSGGSEFVIGEAFSFGWKTIKENMGFFILLTIAIIVIGMIPGFIQGMLGAHSMMANLLFGIISMVVQGIVTMGYIRICLIYTDGQKAGFDQLFSCVNLIPNYIATTILCFLATVVASILGLIFYFVIGIYFSSGLLLLLLTLVLLVPGFIIMLRLMFYLFAIVDRNMGPIQSIGASWRMTQGVTMDLLLLFLLYLVINVIGVIPLGLGLLITIPMSSLAYAYVYRRLEQRVVEPATARAFAA